MLEQLIHIIFSPFVFYFLDSLKHCHIHWHSSHVIILVELPSFYFACQDQSNIRKRIANILVYLKKCVNSDNGVSHMIQKRERERERERESLWSDEALEEGKHG